jgi:hypothetical protein
VGTIVLEIPQVRPGTYCPSLLEPRRRGERARAAVVQEASRHGGSTRKLDELMKALGLEGVSRSEVSRVCAALGTHDLDVLSSSHAKTPTPATHDHNTAGSSVVEHEDGGDDQIPPLDGTRPPAALGVRARLR